MNKRHQLEWAYREGYRIDQLPMTTLQSQELTFETFTAKMPTKTYEIQRIEVEMEDGDIYMVQSQTKNTISFSSRYIVISEARRMLGLGAIFYYKYSLRRKHVKQVRIWHDTPKPLWINHIEDGDDEM